jgi:hypothetical protein
MISIFLFTLTPTLPRKRETGKTDAETHSC